jgi:predicted metal-binding transcription factor (methanogenesis marker protein 9)
MTAVEWLDEQLQEYVIAADHVANTIVIQISFEEYMDLKKQAKEMHKQEIVNAWEEGESSVYITSGEIYTDGDAKQYYQETFVSKGSDEHIEHKLDEINTSSQTEISDEEIEKEANNLFAGDLMWSERIAFKVAIKWYREQLKKKQ